VQVPEDCAADAEYLLLEEEAGADPEDDMSLTE
jgi:hypothetical protein